MEIRPQNDPSRRLGSSDITRPIRSGVQHKVEQDAEVRAEERVEVRAQERTEALRKLVSPISTPETEAASGNRGDADRIEVSAAGSLLAGRGPSEAQADAARAERVAELKAAHERGDLNTPERVDLAARRLLGDG